MATSTGSGVYERLERLHLRQAVQRLVPVAGALTLNGAGWLTVAFLPVHAATGRALGSSPQADGAVAALGAAAVAGSAALRIAAKGVLVRKTEVTAVGVYSHVRHPYYLANLVGCVGVLLLAGAPGVVVALGWLALAFPIFHRTLRGEEAGLERVHGSAWTDYAARTPRLLPRPLRAGSATPAGRGVSWANLVAEHEPPRLCRFIAGAAAVASCRFVGAPAWTLGGLAAVLFVGSHVLARLRRPRGDRAGGPHEAGSAPPPPASGG